MSTLYTIQQHLSRDKGKLYGLFVDFKSAFDSINHPLLFRKLKQIGINSKIIRIIEDMYNKASIKIKVDTKLSKQIGITKGVLQGEILSPLLFALFLSDLKEYMRNKGIRGVSGNHKTEILLLAYADDIILLADTYTGIKSILFNLHEYCMINKLNVNTNKTKIILF